MTQRRTTLSGPAVPEVLEQIDQAIQKEFDSNRRILSFEEYLTLLGENPEKQTRGSSQYVVDMMDHFGTAPSQVSDTLIAGPLDRFKLFDLPIDGIAPKVVGQERVQNQIYRALKAFARQGLNNKLIFPWSQWKR